MRASLPQSNSVSVLADRVILSLRDAILGGYFRPGERLDQDWIAEELGVSKTPVREALKRLEVEGFIEIRPHRGAFVSSVSNQDIRDIYEIRRLLETEAVRQVTPVIPDSVLQDLEARLAEDQKQLENGDTSRNYDSDAYFHATIIRSVENKLLLEMLDSLNNRIVRVRSFAQRRPGDHLSVGAEEHLSILRAMQARDPELAAELLGNHLEHSSIRLRKLREEALDENGRIAEGG